MKTFYFTFGQQYGTTEIHPQGGHKDGWFAVEANDSEEARTRMLIRCGDMWSMQYDKEPSREFYPLGELDRL